MIKVAGVIFFRNYVAQIFGVIWRVRKAFQESASLPSVSLPSVCLPSACLLLVSLSVVHRQKVIRVMPSVLQIALEQTGGESDPVSSPNAIRSLECSTNGDL